ncbi:MAG: type II secretion system protein GspM [Burkholderiaceae bacterium]
MVEGLLGWWRTLSARDRRILLMAIVFLVLVSGWLLAFEPAWNGRITLAKELPALRGELAQMEQLALESRAVGRQAQQPIESTAQLRQRIEQSLKQAELDAAVAQLEASGDLIEARFRQASFERWLYWLDGAIRDTRLRVVDLALTREAAGVISGRVALEAPRRGQ